MIFIPTMSPPQPGRWSEVPEDDDDNILSNKVNHFSYPSFNMGLGHASKDKAFLEMYQYDETFGVLVHDKDKGTESRKEVKNVHQNVGDYIWFELRIAEDKAINVRIRTDLIVTTLLATEGETCPDSPSTCRDT